MKKIGKNYYRDELLKLKEESMKNPIVFTGKYKHGESDLQVTRTTYYNITNPEGNPFVY